MGFLKKLFGMGTGNEPKMEADQPSALEKEANPESSTGQTSEQTSTEPVEQQSDNPI